MAFDLEAASYVIRVWFGNAAQQKDFITEEPEVSLPLGRGLEGVGHCSAASPQNATTTDGEC